MAVDPLDRPATGEGCGALAEFRYHFAGKTVILQRFRRDVLTGEGHFAHLVRETAFDTFHAGLLSCGPRFGLVPDHFLSSFLRLRGSDCGQKKALL